MPTALDNFDRIVTEIMDRITDAQLRRLAACDNADLRRQAADALIARTAADLALGCPVSDEALLELAYLLIHRSNEP